MTATPIVAVIGAGKMGRGIALAAAIGGYRTILEDVLPSSLRKAEGEFRNYLDHAKESDAVSPEAAALALRHIEYADSIEAAARDADIVIEAVPEELESKIEIFTLLDKICRPSTILVCTTSILSVAEIARVTYRTDKCVGMRFTDPVIEMKQLDIVRICDTSDATLTAARDLAAHMGKHVVVIEETTSVF